MRKTTILVAVMMAASLLSISCEAPTATNNSVASRPANAANGAASNATAPSANAAAIETEIKRLANDGIAAITKGDTAALEKLWADNYVFISQDGAVATKAQRIDSMKSGQSKIETLAYDEMSVKSNPEGTGAILVGRATVKGTNMGKPVDGQMRFTQVWAKMPDGWRSVHGQVTSIAAGASDAKTAGTNSNANGAAPVNK